MKQARDVPGFLCSVANRAGRVFNVRLVRQGDTYGLANCITHRESAVLVEFYDATYANKPGNPLYPETGFGPLGQFVSRYYVETLTRDSADLVARGLCLHGGVPGWNVEGPNMQAVFDYLARVKP